MSKISAGSSLTSTNENQPVQNLRKTDTYSNWLKQKNENKHNLNQKLCVFEILEMQNNNGPSINNLFGCHPKENHTLYDL